MPGIISHHFHLVSYAVSMRNQLEYVGKALLLEFIAMLVPCMVLWFHTGNSRGLQENDTITADKLQILVDNKSMDVETFLIHVISVDYQPEMEEEALKALAVAVRSHVYAHLNRYCLQQTNDEEAVSMDSGETKGIFSGLDGEPDREPRKIEADQLGVACHTPSEMAYFLQEAEPERHWSEIYQDIKKAVTATSGQYLTCFQAGSENQAGEPDQTDELNRAGEPDQADKTKGTLSVDALWHEISAGRTRFYEGNLTGKEDGISLYSPEQKAMDGKDGMLPQAVKITVYTRRQIAKYLWEISGTENILEEGTSLSSLFKIEERDDSGYIEELSIGNRKMTGDEAAQLLQISSGCFYVSDLGDSIKIVTFGTGTGYGMSLAGASAMASQGADYKEILEYYFPVCQIE